MRMLLQRGLLPAASGIARRATAVAVRPTLRIAVCGAQQQRTAAPCYTSVAAAAAAMVLVEPRGTHSRLVHCCSSAADGAEAAGAAAAAASNWAGKEQQQEPEYMVINFYHLVDIPDTKEVRGPDGRALFVAILERSPRVGRFSTPLLQAEQNHIVGRSGPRGSGQTQ